MSSRGRRPLPSRRRPRPRPPRRRPVPRPSSPVRTLSFASKEFDSDLAMFGRDAAVPAAVSRSVAAILSAIRAGGDAAVARYALRFDGARLGPRTFRVGRDEIDRARKGLSADRRAALKAAHASIRDFNRRTLPADWRA